MHEEFPGEGRAYSRAHAEYMLGQAKTMNCNFVRLAHYPHNEHMLRVADSLGANDMERNTCLLGYKVGTTTCLIKGKVNTLRNDPQRSK